MVIDKLSLVSKFLNRNLGKNHSVYDLSDHVSYEQLIELLLKACVYISNGGNSQQVTSTAVPGSLHSNINTVKVQDGIEILLDVISQYLTMLRYPSAYFLFHHSKLVAENDKNREKILECLYFLAENISRHEKRAYLFVYLESMDIPEEFSHDERKFYDNTKLSELQDSFKLVHKKAEESRAVREKTVALKKEISELEAVKGKVHSKINEKKLKTESVKNFSAWLKMSNDLRLTLCLEKELELKINDQKHILDLKFKEMEEIRAKKAEFEANADGAIVLAKQLAKQDTLQQDLEQQIEKLDSDIQIMNMVSSFKDSDNTDLEIIRKERDELSQRLGKNSNLITQLTNFKAQKESLSVQKQEKEAILKSLRENVDSADNSEKLKRMLDEMLANDTFKSYAVEFKNLQSLYKEKKKLIETLSTKNENNTPILSIQTRKEYQQEIEHLQEYIKSEKVKLVPIIQKIKDMKLELQDLEENANNDKSNRLAIHVALQLKNLKSEIADLEQRSQSSHKKLDSFNSKRDKFIGNKTQLKNEIEKTAEYSKKTFESIQKVKDQLEEKVESMGETIEILNSIEQLLSIRLVNCSSNLEISGKSIASSIFGSSDNNHLVIS